MWCIGSDCSLFGRRHSHDCCKSKCLTIRSHLRLTTAITSQEHKTFIVQLFCHDVYINCTINYTKMFWSSSANVYICFAKSTSPPCKGKVFPLTLSFYIIVYFFEIYRWYKIQRSIQTSHDVWMDLCRKPHQIDLNMMTTYVILIQSIRYKRYCIPVSFVRLVITV